MRKWIAVAVLGLAGCEKAPEAARDMISPPAAYANFSDRVAAQMLLWGLPSQLPCLRNRYTEAETLMSDDECFRHLAPERFHGLWRDDPRGARFCPSPARTCTRMSAGARIHLELKEAWALNLPVLGGGALYAVDFIGRRSAHSGRYTPYLADGYPEEIVLDRMISMKELEPPVRTSTPVPQASERAN